MNGYIYRLLDEWTNGWRHTVCWFPGSSTLTQRIEANGPWSCLPGLDAFLFLSTAECVMWSDAKEARLQNSTTDGNKHLLPPPAQVWFGFLSGDVGCIFQLELWTLHAAWRHNKESRGRTSAGSMTNLGNKKNTCRQRSSFKCQPSKSCFFFFVCERSDEEPSENIPLKGRCGKSTTAQWKESARHAFLAKRNSPQSQMGGWFMQNLGCNEIIYGAFCKCCKNAATHLIAVEIIFFLNHFNLTTFFFLVELNFFPLYKYVFK